MRYVLDSLHFPSDGSFLLLLPRPAPVHHEVAHISIRRWSRDSKRLRDQLARSACRPPPSGLPLETRPKSSKRRLPDPKVPLFTQLDATSAPVNLAASRDASIVPQAAQHVSPLYATHLRSQLRLPEPILPSLSQQDATGWSNAAHRPYSFAANISPTSQFAASSSIRQQQPNFHASSPSPNRAAQIAPSLVQSGAPSFAVQSPTTPQTQPPQSFGHESVNLDVSSRNVVGGLPGSGNNSSPWCVLALELQCFGHEADLNPAYAGQAQCRPTTPTRFHLERRYFRNGLHRSMTPCRSCRRQTRQVSTLRRIFTLI